MQDPKHIFSVGISERDDNRLVVVINGPDYNKLVLPLPAARALTEILSVTVDALAKAEGEVVIQRPKLKAVEDTVA